MVTSPAVPPYSSRTMAMWTLAALQLVEQVVDAHRLGHEERRAQQRAELGRLFGRP